MPSKIVQSVATGMNGMNVRDVLPKRDKMWWSYPKLLKLNLLLLCAIVSDVSVSRTTRS